MHGLPSTLAPSLEGLSREQLADLADNHPSRGVRRRARSKLVNLPPASAPETAAARPARPTARTRAAAKNLKAGTR